MKTPTLRRTAAAPPPSPVWSGPATITVAGASGGSGTSTLCALLAFGVTASTGTAEPLVAIVDDAHGAVSPWPDLISPGLDPKLGHEGAHALLDFVAPDDGFPRSMLLRCSHAVRGLGGVAVLTATIRSSSTPPVPIARNAFTVVIRDGAREPDLARAVTLRQQQSDFVLVMSGDADGIAAGIAATRAWAAAGLAPNRIRPVVVNRTPGGLSPRAKARLALLDANAEQVTVVPFDPAISRRGLAEALASGAIGAPTRIAVHRILSALSVTVHAPAEMLGLHELPFFPVPLPERTLR